MRYPRRHFQGAARSQALRSMHTRIRLRPRLRTDQLAFSAQEIDLKSSVVTSILLPNFSGGNHATRYRETVIRDREACFVENVEWRGWKVQSTGIAVNNDIRGGFSGRVVYQTENLIRYRPRGASSAA